MATKKPDVKKPAAGTTAKKNTSAPASPGPTAEVSAAGAASAAPLAPTPDLVTGSSVSSKITDTPPSGDGAENKAGQPSGNDPVVHSLIVSAKVDGFRRAGRRWGATPETVSADVFTKAQIEALLAEPMLSVVVVAD